LRRPLLATGVTLLVLAGAAPGQVSKTVPFHGSEFFRFALHGKELKPLSGPREALDDPPGTVIVIVGNTTNLSRHFNGAALRDFVFGGGAVLLATDGPTDVSFPWQQAFGFSIMGQPLSANPADCYGDPETGTTTRPFVRPLPARDRAHPSPFELFEDVPDRGPAAIATDGPCELRLLGWRGPLQRTALARYPPGTRVVGTRQPIPDNSSFAISLQQEIGSGRMLVLADGDVFANGMMGFKEDQTQPNGYRLDNGNWAFANRVILWLQSGPLKLRSRCLFIENGYIVDKFAYELPRPPVPDIPPDVLANILLNHSNGVMNELQEKNFFNRAIEGFFGFPRIVRAFLVAATALFLFYGLRWLVRGYRKQEPAAVTGPAQQAALIPRGGVLRQRTAAQIEVGNLSEAAGRRVRDRFDVLGGRPAAGGIPPVLVANDVPDGPLLRQTIHRLWEIGYGETAVNVPPTEWDRINALLERVTARAARGDWSFGQDVG
jgi:hypothetical protein